MADQKTGSSLGTISLIAFFSLMVAALVMPTTILLAAGMLPTIVAALTVRTGRRDHVLTVGAMNFAGCMPFLLPLWTSDNTINHALYILTDLRSLIVMYCGAGIGYLIAWAMGGIVNTVMLQRAGGRLKDIGKRKAELEERWGPEVTGDMVLNAQGFAAEEKPAGDAGE